MSLVSLHRSTNYDPAYLDDALTQLLAPMGGMATFVRPGDRVLLKPNLLTGARPTKECTTRPALVRAVAQQVLAVGGNPFLGDSPAFGSARGVAKANGLLAVAEELHLPLVEFSGDRYANGGAIANLRLSKEAMGADVVINLPKVKSHMQLTLTLGVKNLFGCVPGKMKAWWHMELGKNPPLFAQMLLETAQAINPQLTIADGIVGHEGNGPSGGEPRFLGVLAASADVFALDRVLVELLGVPPERVPTVALGMELGYGPDLGDIAIAGADLADLQISDWKLPDHLIPIDFGFPRVVKSTFKHLYIKFIKEPLAAYARS
ncbi:MAG: DUF362 domain-containing protein [Oscillatoriales cyanobacterium SM2_2_1]|nr:DUF362 domain-containing protein [Oscillatoriales cyanobacterium SM2_2_1]